MSTVTDDQLNRLCQVSQESSERLRQEIRELNREMKDRFAEVPTRHEIGLKFGSLNSRLTCSDAILYLIWFVVALILGLAVGLTKVH